MSAEVPHGDRQLAIPTREAEGLVRLIEAAPGVRRRYHFFVWMQSHVHLLLPHALAVCGAYRRQQREMVFEVFHGIVLPPPVLQALGGSRSSALDQATQAWLDHGGVPTVLSPASLEAKADPAAAVVWQGLRAAGLGHLLVHGVSRPDRPGEIESLFLFADAPAQPAPSRTGYLDMLMPHLHSVYLRVQAAERELGMPPPRTRHLPAGAAVEHWHITDREREILSWVRQGKSNLQIATELGISALTVKNHVQKILRKMGASNRAQAVSMAISANLLKEAGRSAPT